MRNHRPRAALLLWLAAAPGAAAAARRELQQGGASGAVDEPMCAQLAERGALVCSSAADLCPQACAAAVTQPPSPPAMCTQLAERGSLQCDINADLCPDACGAAAVGVSPATVAAGFHTSCSILLELPGGCAHDLSVADPSVLADTRVGNVCPMECSGRGGCVSAALDVSFLGSVVDSSGHGHTVDVRSGACVDSGVTLSETGSVELGIGGSYAADGAFAIALWLLKAPADAWNPRVDVGTSKEVLFSHAARDDLQTRTDSGHVEIAFARESWMHMWRLEVDVGGLGFAEFELNLYQDFVPRWAHLSVSVTTNGDIIAYLDGESLHSRVVATNLVLALSEPLQLRQGEAQNCAFDACVNNGSCAVETLNMCGGRCAGTNGVRHCGAARSSTIGWGGEPGLAIDGDSGGIYNCDTCDEHTTSGAGCSATDKTPDHQRPWWQLDLQVDASINRVDVWHRIDGNPSVLERLEHSRVFVSDTPDYQSATAQLCGVVKDHTQVPEKIVCGRELTGRYITVASDPNGVLNFDKEIVTICEVAVWGTSEARSQRTFRGASGMATTASIGSRDSRASFRGTVAMLQIYDRALSADEVACLFGSGSVLVQNGRLATTSASQCASATTGCTSPVADNGPEFGTRAAAVDDGSCVFDLKPAAGAGESGELVVTDTWQHITLQLPYRLPVVMCGVITRYATTQAIVRVRKVAMDISGAWSFEVRAEQKSCHFAAPPPALEHISYLVTETGVFEEGWQAGIIQIDDLEWHRVSFLRDFSHFSGAPVVVAQVQTYDNRTSFVTTRTRLATQTNGTQSAAFFLQTQGEGVWCQDGEFFAEYFDSLDLSGNPLATQCELDIPSWNWHATSAGVPPPLLGKTRTLPAELFSARWTARLTVAESSDYTFSSYANRGSRIIVDGTTILDEWARCCSTFNAEPMTLSTGYHTIMYEYRSGWNADYAPTNSYAQLTWTVGNGRVFGGVSGSNNNTNVTSTASQLFSNVGWLACSKGSGIIQGTAYEAGFVASDSNLVTDIQFVYTFTAPPNLFASIVSTSDSNSHLRLLEVADRNVSVAVEYDNCDAVFAQVDETIGWIAVATRGTGTVIVQRPTSPTDMAALLAIGTALHLPEYFHWRSSSDPCRDRWTGIECRTDGAGTPRIVVLDIHNVDLTNQDIPCGAIGQLTALEEISMWNCGLTGEIIAAFMCLLTELQVLALNRNKLRGTVPECMSDLPLQVLYLNNNNFHGPLAELSPLGQYLKQVPSLSLERNRWAPLLASEKQALADVSEPLGVVTHEHEHNWDFGYSYDWEWASGSAEEGRLTAAREVSYRQWGAGVPFEGLLVELGFEFPAQGSTVATVGVGRDGDFSAGHRDKLGYREPTADSSGWFGYGVGGGGAYMGCFDNANPDANPDAVSNSNWGLHGPMTENPTTPGEARDNCGGRCDGYQFFGLRWTNGCICGNYYGQPANEEVCGNQGSLCGLGLVAVDGTTPLCGGANAVFESVAWKLAEGSSVALNGVQGSSCWSSLPALVPNPHSISEQSTDRSSQGEAYFSERFCPGWSSFILPPCDPDAQACDAASPGNAVFDGGNDMYDIGNLIVTNLMGDCTNDPHDCALGSLTYRSDFESVPTNCFGAGGHYQMQQSAALWVFFTTNVHDSPIDFMITGNLGSDGSGTVTEYVFDAAPHMGFVKRECGDAEGDPSVNHMIIVESSQGRLTHSCDYMHGARGGGDCTGASSDLDNDIVSGIAPGSPILYLLYSTQAGSCMKEDEHRAIFDVAALCILAADPFSSLNRGQTVGSAMLAEVDVDDAGHILFGGKASYVGWTRGNPRAVSGPSGFVNALQFEDHDWLQLGETSVDIAGNWTLDCWIQVTAGGLRSMGEVGVLVESAEGSPHVSMRRQNQRVELGSKSDEAWVSSGIDVSGLQDWVRLTVRAQRSMSIHETHSYFVDGQQAGRLQLDASMVCDDALCPVNFFAVGGRSDGTASFPLPLHRVRLFEGALEPSELDTSGGQVGDLVRFQPENSRSIKLSRGTDALDITWNTIGWNAAAHDHVHVELDYLGGVSLRCNNVSSLWDRAVASTGAITGGSDIGNWTSSALESDASTGLRVRYIDSDPCFDLWPGITCSLSDWPVGLDDCAARLNCDALGWAADDHGSASVCGSSSLAGTFGSGDMCVRESSYADASSLCTEMGGRLCTANELEQGEGDPATCSYDSIFKWSWVDTPADTCSFSNQSLGMGGRNGVWFSFVPTVTHAFYEIQLRSEGSFDGDTFTILGVFDAHAEMMPGQPATMYHRENGAMLRWNATQAGSAAFVHISSLVPNADYTMAAVVPSVYSWRAVPSQASQSFGAARLSLQKGSAVAVDLQFSFPYFGLQYRRVWVSSFGMILFEQPSAVGTPFGGVGSTHSAIMAAAGEYDLNRAGAYVTFQVSPTELEVAWHAPLFGSDAFSDVAATLRADGSIVITWETIDLSNGGSLGHRLAALFEGTAELPLADGAEIADASGRSSDGSVFVTSEYLGDVCMARQLKDQSCSRGHASVSPGADAATNVTVGSIYGGDPGEGLDFVGEFLFAVNFYGRAGVRIGDALFTAPPKDTHLRSTSGDCVLDHGDWGGPGVEADAPPYGGSPDDAALAEVLKGTYFSADDPAFTDLGWGGQLGGGRSSTATLRGLTPGETYSLQLLWREPGWWHRQFNVYVDGTFLAHVDPAIMQGGLNNWHTTAAFLRHNFVASNSEVVIVLAGEDPTLFGLTLEHITAQQAHSGHVPDMALRLVDDAYLQLPAMTLGYAIAVSAWVRVGTLWDGEVGITLFSTFQSDTCGDSDACRNAVDETLSSGGWFAVGNDVSAKRPADLWGANTIYDQGTAGLLWEGARDEWMMVTVSVSGTEAEAYASGELRGVGQMTSRLPRMLRHNNYIGAAHHAPYQHKAGGITMAVADFRLYDRSLSAKEVAALFDDPASECCISAGLKDAFGVNDLDLTALAMGVDPQRSSVSITPSGSNGGDPSNGVVAPGCAGADDGTALRELDICGEINEVSDCEGVITDGMCKCYAFFSLCFLATLTEPGFGVQVWVHMATCSTAGCGSTALSAALTLSRLRSSRPNRMWTYSQCTTAAQPTHPCWYSSVARTCLPRSHPQEATCTCSSHPTTTLWRLAFG